MQCEEVQADWDIMPVSAAHCRHSTPACPWFQELYRYASTFLSRRCALSPRHPVFLNMYSMPN